MTFQNFLACSVLSIVLVACSGGESNDGGSAAPSSTDSEAGNTVASQAPAPTETSDAAETSAVSAVSGPPKAFAQCSICHSTQPGKNMIGPSLTGIYGEKAGEVEGFRFSPAMLKSGLVWDDATLDAYLENPRKVVPGTRMSYAGMKNPEMRKEVIAYIKSLTS
ncbi:cytochrome c family protein [Altericroceibacterium indicum]|uniref:c-type cytochrome n=1 Tax=Altericroceibacterium indicum TaxID=374177 RepID=UPI0031B64C9E